LHGIEHRALRFTQGRPVFLFPEKFVRRAARAKQPQLARGFHITVFRFCIPGQQFLPDAGKNFGDARCLQVILKIPHKVIAACDELCNYALEHSHRLPATGSWVVSLSGNC
jgi:hypothetical protein